MTLDAHSPNPTPIWRFWLPLLFQTALILVVPAQAVYTQLTGKTVILQTVPLDPYELLRGYSQTLRYDISSQNNLRALPGWEELPKQQPNGNELTLVESGTRFYVILEAPMSPDTTELPPAWKPVAVSFERPLRLATNQVALKGLAENGFIQYGLETYSIPEDQRDQIITDLHASSNVNPTQEQQTLPPAKPTHPLKKPPVVMEIKVNAEGKAVPVSLWARVGRASKQQIYNYRF